jgi:hypothetical protein
MSTTAAARQGGREATLTISKGPTGEVLRASVPSDLTERELAHVSEQALGLIKKLTKCNCLSGRISYVVEENYGEVIRVNLNAASSRSE